MSEPATDVRTPTRRPELERLARLERNEDGSVGLLSPTDALRTIELLRRR